MHAPQRLLRTSDNRLVAEGDPAGVLLAYAAGDEMTAEDAQRWSAAQDTHAADEPDADSDEAADAKQAAPPANKAARRSANK